jgi:hypothetical protein
MSEVILLLSGRDFSMAFRRPMVATRTHYCPHIVDWEKLPAKVKANEGDGTKKLTGQGWAVPNLKRFTRQRSEEYLPKK